MELICLLIWAREENPPSTDRVVLNKLHHAAHNQQMHDASSIGGSRVFYWFLGTASLKPRAMGECMALKGTTSLESHRFSHETRMKIMGSLWMFTSIHRDGGTAQAVALWILADETFDAEGRGQRRGWNGCYQQQRRSRPVWLGSVEQTSVNTCKYHLWLPWTCESSGKRWWVSCISFWKRCEFTYGVYHLSEFLRPKQPSSETFPCLSGRGRPSSIAIVSTTGIGMDLWGVTECGTICPHFYGRKGPPTLEGKPI